MGKNSAALVVVQRLSYILYRREQDFYRIFLTSEVNDPIYPIASQPSIHRCVFLFILSEKRRESIQTAFLNILCGRKL